MMNQPLPLNLVVEGIIDLEVMRVLLDYLDLPFRGLPPTVGKGKLLNNLPRYNAAARHSPWLVLVDLDQDADCAPSFRAEKLPDPSSGMLLRVAVRAIEAWLLADREQMAAFLGVQINQVPAYPEGEANPKKTIVQLASKSRRKSLREDMLPREGRGGLVGPGYSIRMIEFARQHWRPGVAAQTADSLARCIRALLELKTQ
ncbi:MAG: hypothetical protein JNM70_02575 [Anaerolineae bacterium]|nr:hypothetical protein [Anaerolineae bacterium]